MLFLKSYARSRRKIPQPSLALPAGDGSTSHCGQVAASYFVDSSAGAAELIRKNLDSLGLKDGFRVLKQNSLRALKTLEAEGVQADFVFVDPPYQMEVEYKNILSAFGGSPLLKTNGVLFAEHFKKFDPGDGFGDLLRYRTLAQGDAVVSFYRRSPAAT